MQKKREPKGSPPVKREAGKTFLLVGVSLAVVIVLVILMLNYAPSQFAGKAIEKPLKPEQCIDAPSGIVTYWDTGNLVESEKLPDGIILVKDLIGPDNEILFRSGGIPIPGIGVDSGPLPSKATIDGQVSKALQFDGKDDVLWAASHPILKFGSSSFTIEGWIKVENIDGAQVIAFNGYSGGPPSYGILLNTGGCGKGTICFIASTNDNLKKSIAKLEGDIAQNQWTHIAVVRSGPKVDFYVNGKLKEEVSDDFDVIADNPGPFSVGAAIDKNFQIVLPLKGAMDEFSVYKRALKAEEIKQVYDAGLKGIKKCTSEAVEVLCNDKKDNDLDGLLDCADTDCQPQTLIALDNEYEATISADACPGAGVTLS